MKLLKNIPKEDQDLFINKTVQHHLCWRVVNIYVQPWAKDRLPTPTFEKSRTG
jgi:hypothetical protein